MSAVEHPQEGAEHTSAIEARATPEAAATCEEVE
jgi:hypothetical protein